MDSPSTAEKAYETLRRAIIEQAIAPGTRLPEDELAAQFGVSRTPIRAVLARLQSEGLVRAGPRRTATVAEPSLSEARKVFAVRRALEREAVRLVAERWTSAHGRRLEGIVKEEEHARKAGDGRASIRLAGDFHLALAEMADNFLLERYLGETVSRCSVILALHARPHSEDCAISEHRHIIETLRSGAPEAAMEAMDRHIDAIVQRASLDAEPAPPPALSEVLSLYSAQVEGTPASRPAVGRKAGKARGVVRRR
ncbi:GntR family transcriptional regulator [Aquabacterium sp. J223]|uniref:GntR family transcriptional regulator n=1 Tax=Aquabacterium sp. J223 TaxID=2898431 RepID=UPI0021AD647B|nr:GntR family transcriptional regulator [Aquabacterium sp. J223]UUX94711.1 GntR family transcriptional regulator [Aquabacterium sp. J223]